MTGPAPTPVAASPLVVVDAAPARIRQPLDLLRLAGLSAALLMLAALGSFASDTGRGASADVARLVHQAPNLFIRLFSVMGTFGALAVPLGLMVAEIARGHSRRLFEALITGLAAMGLIEALDWVLARFPTSPLDDSLTAGGSGRPLDAYLAALLAFITVIGVSGQPLWRRLTVTMTVIYVGSVLVGNEAPLLSPLASMTLGAMAGVLVSYLVGRVNQHPNGFRIAEELARRGLPLARLERAAGAGQDHRTYLATTRAGERVIVHVLDRDLIASGALQSVYRLVRVRRELAPTPALSLERTAERRSLLAMAITEAGVPVPRLVAGVPCGPDTIALVYQAVDATALRSPSDDQLAELWGRVADLHRHRIAHRGLTVGRILVDGAGKVLLPIPEDGTAFAGDLTISLDRAQLLATCTQLAGPERAVRGARTVLSEDELAATLSVLQPIALTRETRAAIKQDPGLLEGLREEIHDQIHRDLPEPAQVERVRPRTIVSIVAAIVAAYLIVGEFGSVNLGSVFATARWRWVPLVLLAAALTHVAAALSLVGYVRERLSFGRTVTAQLAGAFAGFVTPPSVGGIAVNVQFLRKAGVSTTGAATAVVAAQVVNAGSHTGLLILFAAVSGGSSSGSLPIPGWAFLAIGAAAALFALAMTIPGARRALGARLGPPLREALPRLLNLLTSPTKLTEATLGSLLLNATFIASLWFAVRAFGGGVGLVGVAVVYLAGAAIGSVAPTPGGLGAIEVALSTGLAAAGMPSAAAVSAVMLYRLATFWLPIPAGWVALQWMQRHDAL